MKRLWLGAALWLAGCAGLPPFGPEHADYMVLALQNGDVALQLDADNPATPWLMQLLNAGYYDGSFIHRAIPAGMVQFGEAYWQGKEPSPHQVIMLQGPPVLPQSLHPGDVALPVLAQPAPQTLVVGPQLLLGRGNGVFTDDIGQPVYRVGRVVGDSTALDHAVKGDKILSADKGQVVANSR